jgi:hypothetical protein
MEISVIYNVQILIIQLVEQIDGTGFRCAKGTSSSLFIKFHETRRRLPKNKRSQVRMKEALRST